MIYVAIDSIEADSIYDSAIAYAPDEFEVIEECDFDGVVWCKCFSQLFCME